MSLGGYFLGIVTFSVVINLIGMLYPSDKNGVRNALDICLSLSLLCAVIAPIGGMVAEAKNEISFDDIVLDFPAGDVEASKLLMDMLAHRSQKEIEEKLFELLSSDFNEEDMAIDAEVSAGENGVVIECVKVYLYGRGLLIDPRDIIAAVAKYTDAECRIIEGRR